MSFLKRVFGQSSKGASPRKLTHPNQLEANDFIQISDSFALPEEIRKQNFKVKSVATWEFERSNYPVLELQGSTDANVYLALESRDKLLFMMEIQRDVVEQLFDLDAFSEIFEEPGQAVIQTLENELPLDQWMADEYHQYDFATMGYHHDKDYRNRAIPQSEDAGIPFELYALFSGNESHSVKLRVWDNGETDVLLCISRSVDDITEMYPHD